MGRKNNIKNVKQQNRSANKSLNKELQNLVNDLLKLTTSTPQQNVNKEYDLQKEMVAILEKIQTYEAQYEIDLPNDLRYKPETIETFLSWLKENNATFEGTSIANFPGFDLGLKANMDIQEASLIIAVPRKLMMTIESAKRTCMGSLIKNDVLLNNMPNVALAMFLLLEKFKESSFWKSYINILPTTYTTVLYFTLEELKELTGSPTLRSALLQNKNIIRQYAYFQKLIWSNDSQFCEILRKHFTFKSYCWAVSTVMTRQNAIPSEDGSNFVNALIPLWDMCNHKNGNISTDYNPSLQRCECLAVKNFKAGEQLFIFYGIRTNADLFVHNGFVYEENEHDAYNLTLGISQSDQFYTKRAKLLERLNLKSTTIFSLCNKPEPIDGDLLAFSRIFNMNDEQLEYWLKSDKCGDLKFIDCALETSLENKLWLFLNGRIKLLMCSYKTSLEDDEKMIQDNKLNDKTILAVKMRLTEKKILKSALEYIEQRIKQ